MDIVIASDSRGYNPGHGENWVDLFAEQNPEHNIIKIVGANRLVSLFERVSYIEKINMNYDIIIVQLGYHEYIVPWTFEIYDLIIKEYDADFDKHLSKVTTSKVGIYNYENSYNYRNDELIKEYFLKIKKLCKSLLFIQMPYSWEAFEKNTLIMNKLYADQCDNFIALPMHYDFVVKNTFNTKHDRVHYLKHYTVEISNAVSDFIKRFDKNINKILL